MVSQTKKKFIMVASLIGAMALVGGVIASANPGNLLKINADTSESRWSRSITFSASDLTGTSVTKNGISFTLSGVTNDGTTATFAEGGYIQADAVAGTAGTTCHGAIYYGFSVAGLTTEAGGKFAYANVGASDDVKTWYNMVNNRGEGDNRAKYTYTDGSTEASAIAYSAINHDWSGERDDNNSSGVWIELNRPKFTASLKAFSVTSLTLYYECQTTGKDYSIIYANASRNVFTLTREDGTSRLPYSFEVNQPLKFKVTPTSAYSDYVFTVAWGHTKSMNASDHGTTLTPVSGVYTLTPDSTTLTSILITYAKATYGVTFSSDAATISYTDSTGTALADQSGTYEKGSNVYFKLTYATGCHGGTVKVSDTALTSDANGVYTISSIAAATTVKLVDPYYTIADVFADFGNTDGATTTADTTNINTAANFTKSTQVVTETGGTAPDTKFRVLSPCILGKYKLVTFSVYADSTAYWELKNIADTTSVNSNIVAGNAASWTQVWFALEGTTYRVYQGTYDSSGWKGFAYSASTNLMDFVMKLGANATFHVSELMGIKADAAYANPYSVIADSPMAANGTENTTVYPTSVPVATKSTELSYVWGKASFASLALSTYKEVLFFIQGKTGSPYTGFAKDGNMLGNENAFAAGSWRIMRLVKVSAGNYLVIGNNYINSASVALANLNELTLQANGAYYFSQVFGIAA